MDSLKRRIEKMEKMDSSSEQRLAKLKELMKSHRGRALIPSKASASTHNIRNIYLGPVRGTPRRRDRD